MYLPICLLCNNSQLFNLHFTAQFLHLSLQSCMEPSLAHSAVMTAYRRNSRQSTASQNVVVAFVIVVVVASPGAAIHIPIFYKHAEVEKVGASTPFRAMSQPKLFKQNACISKPSKTSLPETGVSGVLAIPTQRCCHQLGSASAADKSLPNS